MLQHDSIIGEDPLVLGRPWPLALLCELAFGFCEFDSGFSFLFWQVLCRLEGGGTWSLPIHEVMLVLVRVRHDALCNSLLLREGLGTPMVRLLLGQWSPVVAIEGRLRFRLVRHLHCCVALWARLR